MWSIRPIRVVVLTCGIVLAGMGALGCTSNRTTRVARFEPGRSPEEVLRPAPASAAYKVKFTDASGEDLRSLGGSKRIVREGDPLGFARWPDGRIAAIAGDEQIPLDALPAAARYVVWTSREKRPTQFSREVGKAATTAVTLTGIGAAAISMAYLDSLEGDRDECDAKRHRRDRGYRWVGADGK